MPHQHDNNCAHEAHDHDHDHDHDQVDLGPQDNLFSKIDILNVTALNTTSSGSAGLQVIKPWHERLDESKCLTSDADDQMIIRVPFTGSVKLRAILLKTGPTDQTPSKVSIFANEDTLDFEDIGDRTPVQELDIAQGREVGEYVVKSVLLPSNTVRPWLTRRSTYLFRTAKFANVSSITLFFPESQGADTVQIYYLGFLGHWTERKKDPVITVYEAQANLADHEKIQGTNAGFNMLQ
ncbi:PITH domain-containing protein [Pterulicium gracile]|uniref:PITH domain-containing protein n=1 Tax=Pterulicium gracile TaxID=1884261 RepID=A0A5C3R070_9AGAR|nr:PITH domain-containing protein [Pterula gracilis]